MKSNLRSVVATLAACCMFVLSARADSILTESGQETVGTIVREDYKEVWIKTDVAEFPIQRNTIILIKRDRPLGEQYKERHAKLMKAEKPDAQAVFELAEWCNVVELRKEARDLYFETIKIDINHEGARYALGYKKEGEYWIQTGLASVPAPNEGDAPTGETATEFMKLFKDGVVARKNGNTMQSQPEYEKAVGYFKAALKLYPSSRETKRQALFCLAEGKQYAAAMDWLEKQFGNEKLWREGKDADVARALIICLVGDKQYERADKELEELLKTYPDDVQLHMSRATMRYEQGKYLECIEDYEKVNEIAKRDKQYSADAMLKIAECYRRLAGDKNKDEMHAKAIQKYDELLKEEPDNLEALYQAGLLLWNQGKKEAAKLRYFQKFYKYSDESDERFKEVCGYLEIKIDK